MKTAVYSKYGGPEVIRIMEVEKPVPKERQVLIRVHAASINPFDWHFMRGKPYVGRLMMGLLKQRVTGPGVDVSGEVEATGTKVTQFKPGDQVFGTCWTACAEYVCANESALALKPKTLSFAQAAALPVAGTTALQALRKKRIGLGNKVLVNGAAGGVGTLAVQIAKQYGADVTAVCSTNNVELLHSIGADTVVDYTTRNFTEGEERYDVLFDCIGNHSLRAYRRILNPGGIILLIGSQTHGPWLGAFQDFIVAQMVAPFVSEKIMPFMAKGNQGDLMTLSELSATGKIRPVIDRCYKLNDVADAIRYLEQGHVRGKVIININDVSLK